MASWQFDLLGIRYLALGTRLSATKLVGSHMLGRPLAHLPIVDWCVSFTGVSAVGVAGAAAYVSQDEGSQRTAKCLYEFGQVSALRPCSKPWLQMHPFLYITPASHMKRTFNG